MPPYGAAKLAVENYLATYGAVHGFAYTIVRPGNVFGPRQDPHGEAGVVAIFARAMLARELVRIFGDGNDERDYVYVLDTVDCIERALAFGKHTAYNAGSGIRTTVNTIFRELAFLTGYERPPEYIAPRPGDLHRITLDASKAARDLGWQPRTPFAAGLRETADFFRDT